jgi:single-stranded-DNA-specific exonuclease
MRSPKRWRLQTQHEAVAQKVASELSVSPLIAQLLLNRNITNLSNARFYLSESPEPVQFDSELLNSIYSLIAETIASNKLIFLYGDYDVDGMSSTAMMVKCLTAMGAVVRYKLPHRFNDGYGLNDSVVDLINNEKCGLFITLDCGITNVSEIQNIKSKTPAKVIIIDHHQIPATRPPADIILNPKDVNMPSELVELCTAGIVYKLVNYLSERVGNIDCDEYLFLAAIGTVADVVELQGENRRIVKLGLQLLNKVKNLGVQAILNNAKWKGYFLTVRDVGFVLAPRLNAAGRLSSARYGVELLLASSRARAEEIANYLEKLNFQRRELDQNVFNQSIDVVDGSDHYEKQSVLVFGEKNWHAGVIGIAASKLAEKYSKPVVIVGFDETIGRGSARSVGDVDIYSLLKQCRSCFEKFGGHKQAAGFSIKQENFSKFKTMLEGVVNTSIEKTQLVENIMIDLELQTKFITRSFIDELSVLEPFGHGNNQPLFYSKNFNVIDSRVVGNGKHLKLTLHDSHDKMSFDAIGFNLAEKLPLVYNSNIHFVFSLEINVWNEKETIQLNIKDMK